MVPAETDEKENETLSGESYRHSARIEGLYPGIFPSSEFPTTLHEMRIDKKHRSSSEVGDLTVYIDLDAKDLKEDDNFIDAFLSVLGIHPKVANFDVFLVSERVLQALSRAKFRNLAELKLNNDLVYEHPELEYDLKEVLNEINEFLLKDQRIDVVHARVIDGPDKDAEAFITVSSSHSKFTHDIKIVIRGSIEKADLEKMVNYLEEGLKIDKLFEKDIFLFN